MTHNNEGHLNIIKNTFYFTLKAFFVFKIFKFLSWLFDHVEKQPDKINFEIYDATTWKANNYNTHIGQYLKMKQQAENDIW